MDYFRTFQFSACFEGQEENGLTNMTFFSPLLLKRGSHLSQSRNRSINTILLVGVPSPLLTVYPNQGTDLNMNTLYT